MSEISPTRAPAFPPRSPLKLAVLISGGGTTLRNLLAKIAAGELDARGRTRSGKFIPTAYTRNIALRRR